jgi:hypothetical protein
MEHSNIPDISQDSEKALLKLESKFALDLDDEAAMQTLPSADQRVHERIVPAVLRDDAQVCTVLAVMKRVLEF